MTRRAPRALPWAALVAIIVGVVARPAHAMEVAAGVEVTGTVYAPKTNLLRVVVGLAVALGLAVAAAHPLVRRIERRMGLTVLVSTGLPFLVMGTVFNLPSVGVLTDDVVTDLRPALEFCLGWLGFVVGMKFDIREIDALPERSGAVAVAVTGLPFVATVSTCLIVLLALDPQLLASPPGAMTANLEAALGRTALRDALVLGACAAPAALVAAVAIARGAGSVSAGIVARITSLNDIAGILVLALVGAFFRPHEAAAAWKLPNVGWLFVTLGLGAVLGVLTYVLVRSAKTLAEEVAYLLGAIAISAGMSGYLAISPLVTCAIAGALLTNLPFSAVPPVARGVVAPSPGSEGASVDVHVTPPGGGGLAELKANIVELERPLYLILLLVVGADWDFTVWQGWLLAPVFVLARVGGKIVGAHLAKLAGPKGLPDAGTLGLALSPQSSVAIATVVSYSTLFRDRGGSSIPWLLTGIIGGALLTELVVQAIVRLRGGLTFDDGALLSNRPEPGDDVHEVSAPRAPRSPTLPYGPEGRQ